MTFRIGLIGLGQIGALYDLQEHTCMTHLRAIKQSTVFELSFAIDPCYSEKKEKLFLVKRFFQI